MSNTLLNNILPIWAETMKTTNIKLNNVSQKYIESIYSLISNAEKDFIDKRNNNNNSFQVNSKKFKRNNLFNLSLYNSNYVPKYIREKSMNEIKYTTNITINMNLELDVSNNKNKKIQVIFYSKSPMKKIQVERYTKYIYTILHILYSQQKHNCGNELDIHIILSNEKKKIPTNNAEILGSHHINSAVTTGCTPKGEILIYRNEEWTKTLIHELFHVLGLDFSSYFLSSSKSQLKKLFYVDSTYNIYETYSEIMATIIHTCMISYKLLEQHNEYRENKEIMSHFIFYTEKLLTYELFFTIFQTIKIMNFMDINDDMFHKAKTNKLYRNSLSSRYKEDTNVFCYYILKLPLLLHINTFISWINSHNTSLFQFKNTQGNINNFIHLLDRLYYDKNREDKEKIVSINKHLYSIKREDNKYNVLFNTMRMTINDYF